MSDEQSPKIEENEAVTNQAADQAMAQSQSTEEGAEGSAKKRRKVESKPALPTDKIYMTKQEYSIPFDIQIKGVILNGQWSRLDRHVEFVVPGDLVEGFEKHYHFVIGNLVAAE